MNTFLNFNPALYEEGARVFLRKVVVPEGRSGFVFCFCFYFPEVFLMLSVQLRTFNKPFDAFMNFNTLL